MLKDCFEKDWSTIGKDKKASAEELKRTHDILENYYPILREVYKHYAAIGRTENTMAINWGIMNDFFCKKVDLIDGKLIPFNRFDSAWGLMKGKKVKPHLIPTLGTNPNNALIRYEFIELYMRMSIERYFSDCIYIYYTHIYIYIL